MKKISFFLFVFFLSSFFLFPLPCVRAVMLSSERIAYVDIEKVFNECKSTKQAKKKMEGEIETKRKKVAELERELRDLEVASREGEIIEPMPNTGLVGEEVEISTPIVVGKPLPEEVISVKKKELNETVEKMKEELTRLEKEITYQILGKIYDVIREIARDEGYAIVLDKKNILYSEMENDLTEKVIKKLNSPE